MSRSVDLFIDSAVPIADLAADLARRAGLSLEGQTEEGSPILTDGASSAVLHEHDFLDDDELVFSRYRYALSARSTAGGHPADTTEARFLRGVASALRPEVSVLLVLDLQYLDGPEGRAPGARSGR